MCREQLGRLPKKVDAITAEGAAVLGVSGDTLAAATRLQQDLGLSFPLLADPQNKVARACGMFGAAMGMPEMGYIVIDKQGRIRTRQVDRRFGGNVDAIVRAVREAKT